MNALIRINKEKVKKYERKLVIHNVKYAIQNAIFSLHGDLSITQMLVNDVNKKKSSEYVIIIS